MNKKSKIVLAIVITILLIMLMIIGYTPSDNENGNDEISKIDIEIDDSKLNIFYFYVGQADCTLIMNEGQVMLIDAGEKTDGEMITKFLKKIGIEKIDYLIGTHSDDDHIGGMANIVQNFEIGNIYMPDREATNEAYTELIRTTNVEIEHVEENDILNIGTASCVVKWVDNKSEYSDNNSSIVLQLNYKDKKYLFTGDIETKIEEKLIENLEEVDVLKVSHHASNSSTSEEFLNIISPKTAIISSGSTYSKFPNIECLKRLVKKVGTDNIYITERDGTIWITSDGTADDVIQKLDKLNLDGAKSTINPNELDIDYLESILVSMFSFLEKNIEKINYV